MDFDYPVIDKKKMGDTLKSYMQEQGLTARDVQEYLGLACVQTVYRWMAGVSVPTVDNLYALSRLMNISIDALVVSKYFIMALGSLSGVFFVLQCVETLQNKVDML